MKSKEELELMANDSIVKDNYMNDMTDEEKYHHRRGFIIGYQKAETEFNNVALADVRLSLPSTAEQQKEADEYGQMVSNTEPRQIEASADFFNGAAYIRMCIDNGNKA